LHAAANITYALSATERAAYHNDGFFIRESAFTGADLTLLCNAAEQAVTRADNQTASGRTYFLDGKRFVDVGSSTMQYEHTSDSTTMRVLEPAHLFAPSIDQLVDAPALAEPMRGLLSTRHISLWTAKLNLKRATEGSGFGWHQDSPYWVHDCGHVDRLPNVMLALDAQSISNGCFRIIRGSHRQGILPGTTDGTQLGGFFTDPSNFSIDDEVCMEVPAGSLIFFNPHSVHGSEPNRSSTPRRALIFTYQPGDFPLLKTGAIRNVI
jgi:hypothetical protein